MPAINPKNLVRTGASFAAALTLSACAAIATPTPAAPAMGVMSGMDTANVPKVPAGMAYVDGKEIYFMHTEVSDAGVAKLLSGMMNSPVLEVPSLSKAPLEMLADVYVFKNGVKGMGPLGFQPDVFDNPPGSKGYTPLRRLVLVTWKDERSSRELKSLADIKATEGKSEITFERPGVVINMPFVTWPDGRR